MHLLCLVEQRLSEDFIKPFSLETDEYLLHDISAREIPLEWRKQLQKINPSSMLVSATAVTSVIFQAFCSLTTPPSLFANNEGHKGHMKQRK